MPLPKFISRRKNCIHFNPLAPAEFEEKIPDIKYINTFNYEEKIKYPIFSIIETDNVFSSYNLNINSYLHEIKDVYDNLYLIIETEKLYDFIFFDVEVENLNELKFTQIHELILTIQGKSDCDELIIEWIRKYINVLSEVRPF